MTPPGIFSFILWVLLFGATACREPDPALGTALIFAGEGTNLSNADALTELAQSHFLAYRFVTSSELDAMSTEELKQYRLLVWPGGESSEMNDSLREETRTRVRDAVRESGLGYVGFCAGAWLAVGPPAPFGHPPYWGFGIVPAPFLEEYDPNGEAPNPIGAIVKIFFPGGKSRHLVWWGGPFFTEFPAGVLARYPDGTAAITQVEAGAGFVTLSGLHPEAPQSWRDGERLHDPDGLDLDLAWRLIESTVKRERLAAF
ncbi:MAG: hypothetical protein NDJ90_01180 [Oligoflexia bacterium]|nr:hypothetical protein [Oligoflexia bacterium]